MLPRRTFLDWHQPLLPAVLGELLRGRDAEAPDFSDTIIVVPTQQAGRRLREALARRAPRGVLDLQIKTPVSVVEGTPPRQVATAAATRLAWTRVLESIPDSAINVVFPRAEGENRDLGWQLRTARLLESLSNTLLDSGLTLQSLVAEHGSELREPERWTQLAALEAALEKQLAGNGLRPRFAWLRERLAAPSLPPGVTKLIVACVPDPSPIFVRFAAAMPAEVLIHADEKSGASFDEWGRPVDSVWSTRRIDIPDATNAIRLARDARDQSAIVVRELSTTREATAYPAIGVADPEVAACLIDDLAARGINAYDPAGKPMRDHELVQLLRIFADGGTFVSGATISRLIRHPIILEFLPPGTAQDVLEEWDRLQNRFMPTELEGILEVTRRGGRGLAELGPPDEAKTKVEGGAPAKRGTSPATLLLLEKMAGWFERMRSGDITGVLGELLKSRTLQPGRAADDEFYAVGRKINQLIQEARDGGFDASSGGLLLHLVLEGLESESHYPDAQGAVLDLDGWLELPWNPATKLILAGFNEGRVPPAERADPFLPESLRRTLGLRTADQRAARDAYLFESVIQSRREKGAVTIVLGRTDRRGEPLAPSRLLFRCDDAELIRRAHSLFQELPLDKPAVASSVSFTLNPLGLAPLCNAGWVPEKMSVTQFRAYLACPFRFFLGYIAKLEEVDDGKSELDPMEFGTVVHEALRLLKDWRELEEHEFDECEEALLARLDDLFVERFGRKPTLQAQLQRESARTRVKAAIRIHGEFVSNGWTLMEVEFPVVGTIAGMKVSGKIDRVDRSADGTIRLTDYKTTASDKEPDKSHFGPVKEDTLPFAVFEDRGKPRAWTDLQLPLYQHLIKAEGPVECGYIVLPNAIEDARYVAAPRVMQFQGEAMACAEGVVKAVQAKTYWPPRDVPRDYFAKLFPMPVEDSVDPAAWTEALSK